LNIHAVLGTTSVIAADLIRLATIVFPFSSLRVSGCGRLGPNKLSQLSVCLLMTSQRVRVCFASVEGVVLGRFFWWVGLGNPTPPHHFLWSPTQPPTTTHNPPPTPPHPPRKKTKTRITLVWGGVFWFCLVFLFLVVGLVFFFCLYREGLRRAEHLSRIHQERRSD